LHDPYHQPRSKLTDWQDSYFKSICDEEIQRA